MTNRMKRQPTEWEKTVLNYDYVQNKVSQILINQLDTNKLVSKICNKQNYSATDKKSHKNGHI